MMAPSRAIRPLKNVCASCARRQLQSRPFSATLRVRDSAESSLPKIAQSTFWASLLPKSLRSSSSPATPKATSKPWNPFTIFIFLGILVGSNAIQIIALRNEMLNLSRKTEAKLGLLREVVQRVKNGEEVDVKGLLGTGDPKSESEWDEVMKELGETDMVAEGKRKRDEKRREKARLREEAEAERKEERDGAVGNREGGAVESGEKGGGRPRFMM